MNFNAKLCELMRLSRRVIISFVIRWEVLEEETVSCVWRVLTDTACGLTSRIWSYGAGSSGGVAESQSSTEGEQESVKRVGRKKQRCAKTTKTYTELPFGAKPPCIRFRAWICEKPRQWVAAERTVVKPEESCCCCWRLRAIVETDRYQSVAWREGVCWGRSVTGNRWVCTILSRAFNLCNGF